MTKELGEQSTLAAEDPMETSPTPHAPDDSTLEPPQADVLGALLAQPALRRLGRYVVLDVLGQGGMGVVLKGYDDELDRQVAIKVLHADLDERHTARLRREAQAMAKLSHPNVVQVYEVGELEGQTYVAMELCKGRTLRDWMQQEPRPGWKACVEVFLQLGEGLAAAHKRGLVHRDFKPGNAILDEEGRARVLDFGLARRDDEVDEPGTIETARTDVRAPAPPLETSLTETGAVLGTPAYMPPEQMGGLEADARSDQFSFCVALYEAVYGERPYEGSSMMALMVSMRSGTVRPAPKGSEVPMALRKVLLRGLAVAPDQRWPSMDALLEELRRVVAPRRWRWMALGVTVGLVAIGGGLGATQALEWMNRCTGARAQLEGAWDDARRQEVQTAILGTGLSYAPGTWERVEPQLDAYADAWAAEHTDACEATRSRDEQTEEDMSLRMGCLHQRRQHLRATVNELSHADATVVENAVQAVASLPGLERCRDLQALRADVPPPEDPVVAQKVAAVDELLVETKAKQDAGKYEDGLRLANEAVEQGAALGYEPLMARAWLRLGRMRRETGDYEGAMQALRKAYGAALAHAMMAEAADASAWLMHALGGRLARPQEALGWAESAEPLSRAAGTDDAHVAYLNARGSVALSQAQYDEAREFHAQALAIRERSLGPDHHHVANTLNHLGRVAHAQAKYDEARDFHERALSIWERTLGPDHPRVGGLFVNLGNVALSQADYDRARSSYERALAIHEQARGSNHHDVAHSLSNLGAVASLQAKHDEARELYGRALIVYEKMLGPDHPDVAGLLNNLGEVAYAQGKHDEARNLYERALAIWGKAHGPGHPTTATALNNLGRLAYAQGEHDEARDFFERALAIYEKALGPEHPNVATALNNLANIAMAQAEHDRARDFLARSLALREKALGPDHPTVARSLFNLGGVAMAQAKHDEARDFFERSLAIYEKALGPDQPDVAHALTGLGQARLGLAEPANALPPLERALTIRTTHAVEPALLAETRFVLARALWTAPATEGRDRPRARTLAEQARDAYASLGDAKKTELAEVQTWLAEHP